jgi:NADH-quinone oxidoreductase subunit M
VNRLPFALWLLALFAFLGLSPSALAATSSGRAVLRAARGDVVELSYSPDGEMMTGEFFIRNDGAAPLEVSRVAVHTTANDPRLPPGVTVELDKPRGGSAASSVSIAPAEERRAVVKWRFAGVRARSFHGHVLVETNGRGAGSEEPGRPLAIGIHAERKAGLGVLDSRALSILVFFPLLGTLLALALRVLRRDRPALLGASSSIVHLAHVALVVTIAARFDRAFGRADGQDGYQLVERAALLPSLGVEYFLGVDGVSLALFALVSLVALAAAVSSFLLRDRSTSYHLLAGPAVTAALGVIASLDAFLLCAFWIAGIVPLFLLVSRRPGIEARAASARWLVASLATATLLGFAVWFLWKNSNATYLVNGVATARSSVIPELARVGWIGKGLSLFGTSAVKVLWVALFAAFAWRLSAFPFPGFSADVLGASDTPTSVLFPAISFATAVAGLLRLNVGVLPEATRWAAPGIAALGVAAVFVSAFAAIAEADPKRFVGRIAAAHAGFVLVGIGSLTPQGLEASVAVAVGQGVIAGLLFVVLGVFEARTGERDLGRFGALASEKPALAVLFGVAMFASLGLPTLAGFWGPFFALVGAFARDRWLGTFAALALVALAGAHLFGLGPVLLGRAASTKNGKTAEAPSLGRAELAALVPLAVFVVALGLLPRLYLSLVDARCLELHRLLDPPGPTQIS